MKKTIATILALSILNGIPAMAAGSTVAITKLAVEDGVISATVTNQGETETRLTLELMKEDGNLTEEEEVYALYQKVLAGQSSETFVLEIPDERNGVSGTGNYYIEVENAEEDRDKVSFAYADRDTYNAFLNTLKTESGKVTQAENAYQLLLPVVTDLSSKGIFFRIGLDYDTFAQSNEAVKKETMKQMYLNGLNTATAENYAPLFKSSYGLALYNLGQRLDGLKALSVKYNQQSIDESLIAEAASMIQASYNVPNELIRDFLVAYGLADINRTDVNLMEQALNAFQVTTGLYATEIGQISGLIQARKYKAYETIVLGCNESKLTTETQLGTLLARAYQSAIQDGQGTGGSGGGGGGGSAIGGSNNKVPVSSDSYFGAVGSGSNENKVQTGSLFSDIPSSHWAKEAVTWLKNKGVVNGTDKGTFEPDRQVTREEFTKMLVLACGLSADAVELTFEDVADDWYTPFIRTAVANGIVNGIDSTRFGIGQNITRQDMAVMVKRALELQGISMNKEKTYTAFDDEVQIADYALESVIALYEAGIINGKGENTFDSVGNATRAEASKILYEALKGGK